MPTTLLIHEIVIDVEAEVSKSKPTVHRDLEASIAISDPKRQQRRKPTCVVLDANGRAVDEHTFPP
ncbi:MAG: hypothetical protein HRU16_10950 [Planctomycetes bacterium]|nr:hypothetical protein [Planctomycetota bacterium]